MLWPTGDENGWRVNFLTQSINPLVVDVASDEERRMYESSVGISTPQAVVPTVLHLICDASASMTGAIIERRLFPAPS